MLENIEVYSDSAGIFPLMAYSATYWVSVLGFSVLSLILALPRAVNPYRNHLLCASLAALSWSLAISLAGESQAIVNGFEVLRNFLCCSILLRWIKQPRSNQETLNNLRQSRPWFENQGMVYGFFFGCSCIVIALPLLSTWASQHSDNHSSWLAPQNMSALVFSTWIASSVLGLLLIEQVLRRATTEQRWGIKYLCLGMGVLFGYDLFFYSDALLFKQIDTQLWQARGMLCAVAAPLIAISITRNQSWSIDIHLSRQVVFHSFSLMACGIYLLIMAFAGYALQFYGGQWGQQLKLSFFFFSLLLLISLLLSDKVRAHLKVQLSKHFFSYRYDYRQQWQSFTNALSLSRQSPPNAVCEAMSRLIDSPGALLWSCEAEHWSLLAHQHWPPLEPERNRYKKNTQAVESEQQSIEEFWQDQRWIIDIEEYRAQPDSYSNLALPEWLMAIPKAWLLIPLFNQQRLLAVLLLKRSDIHPTVNWEDRDLIKTASQHAAVYLDQHLMHQRLIAARQFEAFNRLSTFVVHDLKNILAQQSLLLTNAERHRSNPDFVDDMITTIRNSVTRMTRLMEQMRSGERSLEHKRVALTKVLQGLEHEFTSAQPRPRFNLSSGCESCWVSADPEQLSTVFAHLIRNAIEATPSDGQIAVGLSRCDDRATITIRDNGCGMSDDFIQQRLFKAFDSTKGLTGMGIGVFESQQVIQQLRGEIQVKSEEGAGTLFTITLPITDTEREDVKATEVANGLPSEPCNKTQSENQDASISPAMLNSTTHDLHKVRYCERH